RPQLWYQLTSRTGSKTLKHLHQQDLNQSRFPELIEKLEYLLALASEKHFGRAAEACAVSQPSLSLGLKQLEETMGVMLVLRGSRFIGLTPEGERMLEWARRIVSDTRAMRQDVKAIKHGLSGQLRIAVIPAALPVIAFITQPLHARHPDIEF